MKFDFTLVRKLTFSAACCLFIFSAIAQEKVATRTAAEVETQFKQGVEAFNAGRYEAALKTFDGLLAGDTNHKRMSAALYLRARAAFQLGRHEIVRTALEELERNFPRSSYLQHGHALLGMTAFQKREYLKAATEFLWVIETARHPVLQNQAKEWASVVLDGYLSPNDLRWLHKNYTRPKGLAYIVLAQARKEMSMNDRDAGEKLIDEYLRAVPDTPLRAELEMLRQHGGESPAAALRVGVVLPLSGIDAEAGQGVYRGIKYAQVTEGKNNGGAALELVVRDSESSLLHALKVTQELVEDPTLVAIIGEVDNSATAAMAALAETKGIPFLAPVATANGIGALGDYVFQLNADREHKSRALADYAFRYLNARTFVTIAPQDDYGQQMADAFSAAVDSLGGEIFAQKWYYGEPQDLGRSFKAIRAAAFRQAFKDSVRLKLYSAGNNPRMMDAENVDIPVTNLNAIFMPLYEEDIRLVAGQCAYFNLQSIIIGGEYWYATDLAKTKELRSYMEGAIFASDYFIDRESPRYKQFRNDFRTRLGATPEKWEIFGYDAASLLLKALQQSGRSRDQLRETLAKTENFVGMKGAMALNNPQQVNSKVNILQFRGGQIVKLR